RRNRNEPLPLQAGKEARQLRSIQRQPEADAFHMRTRHLLATLLLLIAAPLRAATDCTKPAVVCERAVPGALPLIDRGQPASIFADAADFPGVLRAVRDLRADLSAV